MNAMHRVLVGDNSLGGGGGGVLKRGYAVMSAFLHTQSSLHYIACK